MDSSPGEDAVKIVERRAEGVGHYVSSMANAAAGFARIGSSSVRSSTVGETASLAPEKSFLKERIHRCSKRCCGFIVRNRHGRPDLPEPPSRSVSGHPYCGQTLHSPAKRLGLPER